ncbi:hypothetical protein EAKF1_ch1732c [Escherichia albertii KF1]|nr:hypothetical protein EAKF1_ch1732c [Escherichia albertii KF1]
MSIEYMELFLDANGVAMRDICKHYSQLCDLPLVTFYTTTTPGRAGK